MATTEGAGQSGGGVATASGSAGASSQAQAPRWKGRLVKRFKLVDELGEGAMGRVYLAEDTVLKRHVALKLLPAKHRDGRPNHRTERLVREARSCASLEHPNVTSVYEIDEAGGVHYIAMELAEGGNLEKLVQMSGPMEVERACQLVAEAAEALGHAHSRGIVHRDIKPANLLLTRSGRCKVCDFGLAMFELEAIDADKARCVGTPYFIAPEVAMGRGATERSDLYSLGCTLWFLLTGRQPYAGTSAREVMKQHVSSPLPDLRKWRPDVPERLAGAIEQACAKDPGQRFESANHFAKVLRTFTIPTGSNNNGIGSNGNGFSGGSGGFGSGGGSGSMQPVDGGVGDGGGGSQVVVLTRSGAMAPVSAAQLEAILPSGGHGGDGGQSRLHVPTALVYTGLGTIAAAGLIALGVWMARQGPGNTAAAAPANAAAVQPAESDSVKSGPQVLAGENALANGGLDDVGGAESKPSGWFVAERCRPQVKVVTEGGNAFLRLTNLDASTTTHADQKIDLDPAWKTVTVAARLRASGFKPGNKGTSGAVFVFEDANGKPLGKTINLPVKSDVPWTEQTESAEVPKGAKKLYLQCVVSYARGTIDFDDVRAVPEK